MGIFICEQYTLRNSKRNKGGHYTVRNKAYLNSLTAKFEFDMPLPKLTLFWIVVRILY